MNAWRFTQVFIWLEADALEKERTSPELWVESYGKSCSPLLWWWLLVKTIWSLDKVFQQLSLLPLPDWVTRAGPALASWSCLSRRQGMHLEQKLSGAVKLISKERDDLSHLASKPRNWTTFCCVLSAHSSSNSAPSQFHLSSRPSLRIVFILYLFSDSQMSLQ